MQARKAIPWFRQAHIQVARRRFWQSIADGAYGLLSEEVAATKNLYNLIK